MSVFFSRNVVTATPGLNPAFWGAAGLFFDKRKQRKVQYKKKYRMHSYFLCPVRLGYSENRQVVN